MLAAAHPSPAASLQLAAVFAVGGGAVSMGRAEDNVVSAVALADAAAPTQRLPDRLISMVRRLAAPPGDA